MAHAWTEKDWYYRELGYATEMQKHAANDEILRDVLKGNNGEGSGWSGHAHRNTELWASATVVLAGRFVQAASYTARGVVYLEEIDLTIDHGATDGSFHPDDSAAEQDFPLLFVRADWSSYAGTELSIGHDSGSYGYNIGVETEAGSFKYVISNNHQSEDAVDFIGQLFSPSS